ncbi:MAG: ABC-F family ATP-binding cassette domain-containing protein [Eubacterium sp.]|nr:ABC-F family ATP-binding cassette domain-containing protein [Eubacterium sp.]
MIALSGTDITKAYGTDVILDRVSFHVNLGDKVGIVGANGAGKTTLLDIIAGDMTPDSGRVFISQDLEIGYLRQNDDFRDHATLLEEVANIYGRFTDMERRMEDLTEEISRMAARGEHGEEQQKLLERYGAIHDEYEKSGGYTYKSDQKGILTSMAFGEEYYEKPISTLSGGERTRLALACLLMRKPEILILDEPTNHLDIGMLRWLEQFLKAYKGTVIIVSHDRYFLDQLATHIFEIENHRLKTYTGNYTEFARKKQEQRAADLRAYGKQQAEIARQEEMIRRFKQRGTEKLAKRAASREKRLEHMERLDKPSAGPASVVMRFTQDFKSGNDVIRAEDISKSFVNGGVRKELFSGVSFDIKRGERVCIVGANGIGKTTLLRIITGEDDPVSGKIIAGHNVLFGYYDQRQESLDPGKTVMDELHDEYRLMTDGEVRGWLGRFLFKGDSVNTLVGSLSGGEKARLALLKLMLSGSNVLVLDEPTNHLDIESKEVFEESLKDYPGTIIAVSHDRYFLRRVATSIYELTADGIVKYPGGYDYYEEKRQEIVSTKKYLGELGASSGQGTAEAGENGQKTTGRSVQEERARKKKLEAEARRKAREQERLELLIMELEEETERIQNEMCKPGIATDPVKLNKLNEELKDVKLRLEEAYENWGGL